MYVKRGIQVIIIRAIFIAESCGSFKKGFPAPVKGRGHGSEEVHQTYLRYARGFVPCEERHPVGHRFMKAWGGVGSRKGMNAVTPGDDLDRNPGCHGRPKRIQLMLERMR